MTNLLALWNWPLIAKRNEFEFWCWKCMVLASSDFTHTHPVRFSSIAGLLDRNVSRICIPSEPFSERVDSRPTPPHRPAAHITPGRWPLTPSTSRQLSRAHPPPPHAHYYDCVVCAVCSWARDNVLVRGSIGQRMAALVAVRAGAIPSSVHRGGVFWAINTHFWLYVLKFKEHAHDMQLFEKNSLKTDQLAYLVWS